MTVAARKLGRDGPELTTLGLGTWAMGGGGWAFGWGPQDDLLSAAAVRHAVDLGVNWVDTAAVYGHGHSEEVVGKAVRALPEAERPYVFTKCGPAWDESDRMKDAPSDLRPESIRRQCEASLRRLGLDHIDLYQFHWPDEDGVPVEESWATMAALADEGKVRWCGVSNFSIELLERCEASGTSTPCSRRSRSSIARSRAGNFRGAASTARV
jgi:aryl-alcohol dehydrogenase-like predicted oxidoreductase